MKLVGQLRLHVSLFLLALATAGAPALAQTVFSLHSSAFEDNGTMAQKFGGAGSPNPNCRGQNVSPPFSWTPGPEGTKSYVLMMFDPEGRLGLGVSHWVAYGIPADVTSLSEGEASKPSEKFVGGKNANNTEVYYGPCPAADTGQHHYVLSLIATDLEPKALKAGLTREELLKELQGHAKAATAMVGRMGY